MKKTKICLTICLVLLLLLLTACGNKEEAVNPNLQTVEYNGRTYIIEYNPNATGGTITVEDMVCEFGISMNGDFNVKYSDGSSYWWRQQGNMGYGGWSDDYDPPAYAEGDVLWNVLGVKSESQKDNRGGPIFLGLLVIGLGVVDVIWPQLGWYLSHGWRFKNAEPSELALFFGRLGGIVICLFGLGVMFFA